MRVALFEALPLGPGKKLACLPSIIPAKQTVEDNLLFTEVMSTPLTKQDEKNGNFCRDKRRPHI